jgi:hypothetical protein
MECRGDGDEGQIHWVAQSCSGLNAYRGLTALATPEPVVRSRRSVGSVSTETRTIHSESHKHFVFEKSPAEHPTGGLNKI